MAVVAPPFRIAHLVERQFPGIWRRWLLPILVLAEQGQLRGVVATSWYRDVDANRRAGGHPQSQHLAGLALDLAVVIDERRSQVTAALAPFSQVVPYRTHLHVQALPPGTLARAGFFA